MYTIPLDELIPAYRPPFNRSTKLVTTMRSLAVSVLLLLLLARSTVASAAANIALSGCQSRCGDVDIPYPFGTTRGCYRPGFMVTCSGSKLLLGRDGRTVLNISVQNSTVRICSPVWSFNVGNTNSKELSIIPNDRPYLLSAAGNRLVHIGCGFIASSWTPLGAHAFNGTCSSSCPKKVPKRLRHYQCDGIGCCDAPIPTGLTSFRAQFQWVDLKGNVSLWMTSDAASVVAVEQEWWRGDNLFMLKMSLLALGHASGSAIPAILDWAFDNSSCAEAAKKPDYGCISKNSGCLDSTGSAYGYICRCSHGYEGNPYVRGGCRSPRIHLSAGIMFATGVGIGMCLLLLALAVIFAAKKLKVRKAKKMREYFFKKNRGLLLQKMVDKDIAERMIFSFEELEKATNKFDEARILGGGGHGMVYKGILSDQHVVAIKKSKNVIQREIYGFINEVAILSQINHRNVVKLFGCCLETEVPLLVYEFVPNRTLYAHLHVHGSQSLPWKDRLRIATEVASSLTYLHSAASISIVHRDIKTSNILLDDYLTAKVSDFGASRGIAINKSGVTTVIQGTYGYLDPEYCYTRRLTEKSDVYSYGVVLVELLTRKKPTVYMSSDGVSLVAHFILLLNEDKLSEILDEQVTEEGEDEAKQVAAIAATCLRLKGDVRPTMRHVEMRLRGLQGSDNNFHNNSATDDNTMLQGSNAAANDNNDSRRYSMEREILLSASLPR